MKLAGKDSEEDDEENEDKDEDWVSADESTKEEGTESEQDDRSSHWGSSEDDEPLEYITHKPLEYITHKPLEYITRKWQQRFLFRSIAEERTWATDVQGYVFLDLEEVFCESQQVFCIRLDYSGSTRKEDSLHKAMKLSVGDAVCVKEAVGDAVCV